MQEKQKRIRLTRGDRLLLVRALAYEIARRMNKGEFREASDCFRLAANLLRDTKGGTPRFDNRKYDDGEYIRDWRTDPWRKSETPAYHRKVVLGWLKPGPNQFEESEWFW